MAAYGAGAAGASCRGRHGRRDGHIAVLSRGRQGSGSAGLDLWGDLEGHLRGRGGRQPEVGGRIDVVAVEDDVEVQVAARGPTGRTDETDHLTAPDDVALLHQEL